MTQALWFCTAILLAGCGTTSRLSTQIAQPVAQYAQFDAIAGSKFEEESVVGLQTAVAIDGEIVWSGAYGMANIEHGAAMTSETPMRVASIVKLMTATAVMRLSENGKLDLDAPVQDYCPRYPQKRWKLTSRHLLNHQGGVRHYIGNNDEPRETDEERAALSERISQARGGQIRRFDNVLDPIDTFKDDPLLFEPGTKIRYSSFGYRLLGCVLVGAAGKPYNDLMQELVFDPSGMTLIQPDDAYKIIPGRADGYRRVEGQLQRARYRDVSENLPAGGYLSTAEDLLSFFIAWNNGDLVSPATKETMSMADPLPEPDEESGYYYYFAYGHQILLDSETDILRIMTSGSQNGAGAVLYYYPSLDAAIAIITNDETFRARGMFELENELKTAIEQIQGVAR